MNYYDEIDPIGMSEISTEPRIPDYTDLLFDECEKVCDLIKSSDSELQDFTNLIEGLKTYSENTYLIKKLSDINKYLSLKNVDILKSVAKIKDFNDGLEPIKIK